MPRSILTLTLLMCLLTQARAGSPNLDTLVVFNGTNGAKPSSNLLLAKDGNLYGTTMEGGVNGLGILFKITQSGQFTLLASFDGRNGQSPSGNLVQDKEGNIYGTTVQGGKGGGGVVFKAASNGNVVGLFSFSDYDERGGESPHGFCPYRLIDDGAGNIYGTTAKSRFGMGMGTVFKITSSGQLTTVATFESSGEAAYVVRDLNGGFHFTTARMGFRLAPMKTVESLKKISSLTSLTESKDRSLYGATFDGGPKGGGTVFKIMPNGSATNLVSFDVNNSVNGRNPTGDLILGTDGNFYGVTFAGDTNGAPPDLTKYVTKEKNGAWVLIDKNRPFPGVKPDLGTVYKMTPSGTITTLAVFNRTNGCYPLSGLVETKRSVFFGTTSEGGAGPNAQGTIFRLTVTP